jgi:hypothetical protein
MKKLLTRCGKKKFNAGHVGLGVNGFEDYMLHYFVSVAPQNKNDQLELSNFFPANQYIGVLRDSAFTYHDWDRTGFNECSGRYERRKIAYNY